MNINSFETSIQETILDRGYDYYIDGNVVETYHQGDDTFIFDVQGSADYEVIVKIDEEGAILYSGCDCPYDLGPICKHEVAAYFELREMFNSQNRRTTVKKEVTRQPEIKDVLNNLSKEELMEIIIHLTKKDKVLRNGLIVKYSKGSDLQELAQCKKLIDAIVRKYTGREDFITYRETYGFVSEMEDVLEKARDVEDTLLALDIALLMLNEAIEAFQYADDSSGEIGGLAEETIELIGEIVTDSKNLESGLREKIFNKLLEESDSKVFDGWEEYRIELLRLCAEYAEIESLRKRLIMKIEHSVNKDSGDEYKKYNNESMLKILLELIEQYGTEEEALEFIRKHLRFTSFRKQLIEKYIREKSYDKVITLALEGEQQDKQYAGLVSTWKQIRYEAYKELSLKGEQGELAKELLFNGDFEYYSELKELVTGDKETFYNHLKQELKKDTGWKSRSIYVQLIVEEKDLDELMKFVRENPRNIEEYAGMLEEKFKDEVIEIYNKYIKAEASSSSNRKEYQSVCAILNRYKKIAGEQNQGKMVNELKVLYKKRPAFIDELSKVN